MKSPFPGMDPWLEAHWGDVHLSLLAEIRARLNSQLPKGLLARAEETVTLSAHSESPKRYFPDLSVEEVGEAIESDTSSSNGGSSTLLVAEPKLLRRVTRQRKRRRLLIIDGDSEDRLISTIEVLSPSNKESVREVRRLRKKQNNLLDAGVNIVEIDLLRGGIKSLPIFGELTERGGRPYSVASVRASDPDQLELYSIGLIETLPTVRIPLRRTDPDAALELQAVLEDVYREGAYFRAINYRREPKPPFTTEERSIVEEILKQAVCN